MSCPKCDSDEKACWCETDRLRAAVKTLREDLALLVRCMQRKTLTIEDAQSILNDMRDLEV